MQLITVNAGSPAEKSDIFLTVAWGNTNQPDFFNQALCLQTSLSAFDLLKELLSIEQILGRARSHEKLTERTMDIDILFYNNDIIDTPGLKIPHPYIQERKFVLAPMAQLAPDLIHPVLKKNMKKLLSECLDESALKKQ